MPFIKPNWPKKTLARPGSTYGLEGLGNERVEGLEGWGIGGIMGRAVKALKGCRVQSVKGLRVILALILSSP